MSTQPPTAGDTIHVGKQWLRQQIDKGAHCPLCGQLAKLYRRKINSGAARGLIIMYHLYKTDWGHLPSTATLARLGGEFARLKLWGLVEEQSAKGPHGGRAGYWRLTDRGVSFVHGSMKVPKYALIYDGRLQGFDAHELIDIKDALGTKFNYQDLMNGV